MIREIRYSTSRIVRPWHSVGVYLIIVSIGSTDQHVVGDVIQMPTVLEPGTRHADMVRGALALGLDQHLGASDVLAVPPRERSQKLQAVALGVNCYAES